MSTRNLTMVVNRKYSSEFEEGFALNPQKVADNSFVNMFLHHDGYPERQGVQLANWVLANNYQDGSRIAAKMVHDHYYNSCYLYPEPDQIDHQYTYIVWTGKKDIWISCYDQYNSTNVFVLQPDGVIKRYKHDMEYTNWSVGDRYKDDLKYRNEEDINNLYKLTPKE